MILTVFEFCVAMSRNNKYRYIKIMIMKTLAAFGTRGRAVQV